MKPIHKRSVILILTVLFITGTGAALAFFDGPKGHRGGCDRHAHHKQQSPMALLARLDGLSDEQRSQLKQIGRSTRDAMRKLRDKMVDNRLNLHDAVADQADQTTIRKLAETQGERVAQMVMLHVETRDKIIGLLTPEQVKQLDTLRRSNGDFALPGNRMGF